MCPRSLIRFFNILTSLWRFGCCTWQKNIFAQEHWGCRNIHSGVFAAAIITSTLPTPGDLLDWRSRFILANHSRLLYRLYSLFSLMTLHCTSVCRRDGWRGERYSELSFTTGKEVCSKNLRVCKRYVYCVYVAAFGWNFFLWKKWNILKFAKIFQPTSPTVEYRMSQKITLLKFLEIKSYVILGNFTRVIFIGTSCTT